MTKKKIGKVEWKHRKAAAKERNSKYLKEFIKEKYYNLNLRFRVEDEQDIIEALESIDGNRQQLVKDLIYRYFDIERPTIERKKGRKKEEKEDEKVK